MYFRWWKSKSHSKGYGENPQNHIFTGRSPSTSIEICSLHLKLLVIYVRLLSVTKPLQPDPSFPEMMWLNISITFRIASLLAQHIIMFFLTACMFCSATSEGVILNQPSVHAVSPTDGHRAARLSLSHAVSRGSYLGELSDLLAHLAVHLVVIELLLDGGQLCRSPVHGGALPGGLCSLTGAWSHNGTPHHLSLSLSLSPRGTSQDQRIVRNDPSASRMKNPKEIVSASYSCISSLRAQILSRHLQESGGRSSGLSWCVPVAAPLSSCWPPGDRGGHTLEVHRGRACASRARPVASRCIYIFLILIGRMRAYSPTTCLGAGAERGVCICGTLPETAAGEAHCCSAAPPLIAVRRGGGWGSPGSVPSVG